MCPAKPPRESTPLSAGFTDAAEALCLLDAGGAVSAANPALTGVFGWTDEALRGQRFDALWHPDDRVELAALRADLDAWAGVAHVAGRLRCADGRYRACECALARAEGGGTRCRLAVEVSPARALLALDRHFALAIDFFCILTADGRYERVNASFSSLLGWSCAEILGFSSVLDIVHEDDITSAGTALKTLLGGAGAMENFEVRLRAKSGEYRLVAWSGRRDPDTGLIYTVGRDITHVDHLLAELRDAQELSKHAMVEAEAASRARSRFLSNMSHELRTPLNGILGYAQLLALDPDLSERQREGVDAVRRSGEHLLILINDVLDLAKMEAGTLPSSLTEVYVSDFLSSLVRLFEARVARKRLAFQQRAINELPPMIRCDEARLRQVLINLISHAIRQSEHGGVFLDIGFSAGMMRFRVEQSPGVESSADFDTFFDPIERLSERSSSIEGTVLELPARLLQALGGQLVVESRDEGSVFWFDVIPEVVPGWTARPVTRRVIEGYDGARRSLLIADDKVENRHILVHLLIPLGFDICEAADGDDAVRKAQELSPDLILMDLVMPVLDGFEATRRIRAAEDQRRIPIIAMSASSFEPDRNRSREAGCDDYLAKPVRRDKLLALLESHLGLTWRSREWADGGGELEGASVAVGGSPGAERGRAGEDIRPAAADDTLALSHAELRAIYDAASIGDIRTILTIVESAEKMRAEPGASGVDGALTRSDVIDDIRRLAKRFQARKIKERIIPLLQRDEGVK
ncbi:MAG: hypothetical protein Tsb0020_31420 [Haliangiales bacterium]